MTDAEKKELEELRNLFKETFKPDFQENPYLMEFDKRLKDLDKKVIKEVISILRLYKSWFIEQSMQIFPMDEAGINYRNGVVIEMSKLLATLEQYGVEKPNQLYRDHGEIASKLNEKKLLS